MIRAYLFEDLSEQERDKIQLYLEQDEEAFQVCLELAASAIAFDLSEEQIFSYLNNAPQNLEELTAPTHHG